VLFADIRGSTAIAEHIEPSAYAALMNRFYRVATEVLVRHDAIVDKLIGDEVMPCSFLGSAERITSVWPPKLRWRCSTPSGIALGPKSGCRWAPRLTLV
jgi:hypothetical protein